MTRVLPRAATAVTPTGTTRQRRVPPRPLAIFTRQFSVMVNAGLPLVQCLGLLARGEPDKRFAQAIARVRADVEAGNSLADAMRRQPHAFDALYTNMIAAGEAGGILDTILERLSVFIEKQAKLRSQLRSAMVYPAAVLSIAAIVLVAILVKVVPAFTVLFQGLGTDLPVATRAVIWASSATILALPFALGGLVTAGVLLRRYYRIPAGRLRIDRALLRLPALGTVLRKIAVARFSRTLAALLGSGVPLLEALEVTARTSGNAIIEAAIRQVRGRIERGDSIARPLGATGVFPAMVVQMIGAGEGTGALDSMLAKIADFYEDEVDAAIAALLAALEPALITILGVVVGAIVVSMYLPLFELVDQLS